MVCSVGFPYFLPKHVPFTTWALELNQDESSRLQIVGLTGLGFRGGGGGVLGAGHRGTPQQYDTE